MNCKAFRKKVDIGFKKTGYEISDELLEHSNSCDACADYLKELRLLQDTLNKPLLEVLPGELDDLSFEKITSSLPSVIKEGRSVTIAWPFKWILAPAVISVAVILIIMLARPGQKNVNDYSRLTIDPYSGMEIDNALLSSDSLSIRVLSSMAGNDADLDHAADELLNDSNIDEMLGSLTPNELRALYNKIDNLKG